jgi:calcineurin-like phosphoesterase family protein
VTRIRHLLAVPILALVALALAGTGTVSAGPPMRPEPSAGDVTASATAVLVGAGDVSDCHLFADTKTARLVASIPGRVFVAGDLAYPSGTAAQFRDCYDPTWGRVFDRTSPAVGNHEYESPGARPYFDYFGSRAGPRGRGWYAYDLGTWRIYVLNANCGFVGCGARSAQVTWLKADLAANPRPCVAAIWHQPLFSSGQHGGTSSVRPFWRALQAAHADLVINGHDHDYERFARQTADGRRSAAGLREFVVGTGGAVFRPFARIAANSQVRQASVHGVLKLTLRAGGYAWRFVPVAGKTWTDGGSGACH